MLVNDLMSRDFRTAAPDMSLQEVAEMMRDGDYGYVPVMEGDRLIGALTDRDIVIRGVALGLEAGSSLRQVITEDILYCFEDDDIQDAADIMKAKQIRRLAVLNEAKQLVGVISLGDIARTARQPKLTGDIETQVARH